MEVLSLGIECNWEVELQVLGRSCFRLRGSVSIVLCILEGDRLALDVVVVSFGHVNHDRRCRGGFRLRSGKGSKGVGAEVVRQRLLVVVVVLVGKLSIASPLALAELPEAAFLATP